MFKKHKKDERALIAYLPIDHHQTVRLPAKHSDGRIADASLIPMTIIKSAYDLRAVRVAPDDALVGSRWYGGIHGSKPPHEASAASRGVVFLPV